MQAAAIVRAIIIIGMALTALLVRYKNYPDEWPMPIALNGASMIAIFSIAIFLTWPRNSGKPSKSLAFKLGQLIGRLRLRG